MLIKKHIPTPWLDSTSKLGEAHPLEYHSVIVDSVQEIVCELVSLEKITDRAHDLLSKVRFDH